MSDAAISSNNHWHDDEAGPVSSLLGAMEEQQSAPWRKKALCLGMDPNIFVPSTDEERKLARATCAECPVKDECLQFALDSERDPGGIYGGTNAQQRRQMKKKRTSEARFKNQGTDTHCVNGHERTPENQGFYDGAERCKVCRKDTNRRAKQRQRDRERAEAEAREAHFQQWLAS